MHTHLHKRPMGHTFHQISFKFSNKSFNPVSHGFISTPGVMMQTNVFKIMFVYNPTKTLHPYWGPTQIIWHPVHLRFLRRTFLKNFHTHVFVKRWNPSIHVGPSQVTGLVVYLQYQIVHVYTRKPPYNFGFPGLVVFEKIF